MKILVTGGAGFIGSAVCRRLIAHTDHAVVNLDKLTYAASLEALTPVAGSPRYRFVQGDVCDQELIVGLMAEEDVDAVLHLAAETHVDRSIDGPAAFVKTNVEGSYALLEAARRRFATLDGAARERFRFVHVSTDEVFGALGEDGAFDETSRYDPRSPYSASKAAADHFARAWAHTYDLPVIVTNSSNNYGPYQFPEKLIPLTILNALQGKPISVYGDGLHVRDWVHVDDHAAGLILALERGQPGETYCMGGRSERANLHVVERICDLVDELAPRDGAPPRRALITFDADRPGHDRRYAIDCAKAEAALGWARATPFEDGLRDVVAWYLANAAWWEPIRAERYAGERQGRGAPA